MTEWTLGKHMPAHGTLKFEVQAIDQKDGETNHVNRIQVYGVGCREIATRIVNGLNRAKGKDNA